MDHTAFVKHRPRRTIFNRLRHIVDVDIVTEHFARIAVHLGDRGSGKSYECRVGKAIANDAGSADMDLAVLIDLFKAVLPAMGLIRHDDNIAPFGKSGFRPFEFLHRGENDAVRFAVGEKLFQVLATGSLLRNLPQKIFALGELPVKLIVQVVAISQHDNRRAVEFLLKQVGEENH